MNTKEIFGKIASRYVLIHMLAMCLVVVLLCFGVKYGLEFYTHHGEGIVVPKIQGMTYNKARLLLEQEGLIILVSDSGYNKTLPADCILAQTPGTGAKVKQGHIIYVTVNSPTSPSFTIPDIVDNSSVREAEAKLTAMGFRLLPAQEVPGERDWVYGIVCRGRRVSNGDRIPIDYPLTLLVGGGNIGESDDFEYVDQSYSEPQETTIDDFEEVTEPATEN
ncbi:MAG: PASTA domain-containing protein [Prevotella sp.]|jgi:beta-lactam-binding protein with PASTA domain|nr:PASTA domain-containing protein [Prevotella sp.]